jgi:hypothetical protein
MSEPLRPRKKKTSPAYGSRLNAHHHRHLLRAVAAMEATLTALRDARWIKDKVALDPALHRLKSGWQELHWATAALPGFEMVHLNQSCCAGHAFARPAQPTAQ